MVSNLLVVWHVDIQKSRHDVLYMLMFMDDNISKCHEQHFFAQDCIVCFCSVGGSQHNIVHCLHMFEKRLLYCLHGHDNG